MAAVMTSDMMIAMEMMKLLSPWTEQQKVHPNHIHLTKPKITKQAKQMSKKCRTAFSIQIKTQENGEKKCLAGMMIESCNRATPLNSSH